MKILYLHSSDINSRMANLHQVISMCNALSEKNEVYLSLLGNRNLSKISTQQLEQIYGKINFTIGTRQTYFSTYGMYFYSKSTHLIIKKYKPDLIYCRSQLYIRLINSFNIPLVFESHDAILHSRLSWFDKFWKKYIINASYTNNFFYLVTISEALKKFWISTGVNPGIIISLHDGFDTKYFKNELSRTDARTQLSLDDQKIIVTYTGSLYKDRGIDYIINLARDFPDVLFLVVGGPDKQKEYYEDFSSNNEIFNIIFIGQVPHKMISTYLYSSDILLGLWSNQVRTIQYCSPLKIFEYMASGRIIVAQAFPTIKEVLDDKVNAILVEPDSYFDLKEKIDYTINNISDIYVGKKARQIAFDNYSWSIRASRILDFISNIESIKH